jgi:hypothetical protein
MSTLTIDRKAEGMTLSFIGADSAMMGDISPDFATEIGFDEEALEGILGEGQEFRLRTGSGIEVECRWGGNPIELGHFMVRWWGRRRGG